MPHQTVTWRPMGAFLIGVFALVAAAATGRLLDMSASEPFVIEARAREFLVQPAQGPGAAQDEQNAGQDRRLDELEKQVRDLWRAIDPGPEPEPEPDSPFILEPAALLWAHANGVDQLTPELVALANEHGAGLFFNNIYGARRGHHHDGAWDWWLYTFRDEPDKLAARTAKLREGLAAYEGPAVHAYLCFKGKRADTLDYFDVTDDRVRGVWVDNYAAVFQNGTPNEIEVEFGVDAASDHYTRWERVAEEILTPLGHRMLYEASVRGPDGYPRQDVPQVFLWQHLERRGWDVDEMPALETPGSVIVWCHNDAWEAIGEKAQDHAMRTLWAKGYGLALNAKELRRWADVIVKPDILTAIESAGNDD